MTARLLTRFNSASARAAVLSLALAAGMVAPLATLAQPATATVDPNWAALSPQQRSVLAPLQGDWHQLGPQRRAKWLDIASRYQSLPPKQQQRMQQRMTEWSRMSPEQRGEARTNFQRSKEFPRRDRQAEWDAYRALPSDERAALAARARPGAAEGTPQRRPTPMQMRAAESGNDEFSGRAAPRASRELPPSYVRGNPGATTNLVNKAPAPPAHQQQSGLPKITASPGMVDRATLLPQRGPQGAGVRGTPASGNRK